jgi:catechol 2,3-dioxygenase-like lactoylglutathione lyase family enzyme
MAEGGTQAGNKFDVGGVLLERPFKVRRLGHFGINMRETAPMLDFYCETLGFRISDPLEVGKRPGEKSVGEPIGYFTRHGTDHHSFVLINTEVAKASGRKDDNLPGVTVNQMTWQVGTLAEVGGAIDWLAAEKVKMHRAGRDMPGSNWHCYFYDPEGHRNELYYGMEQVGWNGASKPLPMHARGFRERPPLPQQPEYQEVTDAMARGDDFGSGFRHPEKLPPKYDVGGILLPRPFKVVRHGPIRLFCRDVQAMADFYRDKMGFLPTEEITWNGHRCVFLRCGTEHHAMALYPIELRAQLGWSDFTTVMGFGLQVGSYRQLRDAVAWLKERGAKLLDVPAELTPGIDYSVWVEDPSGHRVQVYYYMEQVGWDGRARTDRPKASTHPQDWPEAVAAQPDTFMGEPFLGPLG